MRRRSLYPSRQSWPAVHLSRTGCDFSMRFCSLGFSNQKATALCDCGLILSEPRKWEGAGMPSESAVHHTVFGSFCTSSFLSAVPQTLQGL